MPKVQVTREKLRLEKGRFSAVPVVHCFRKGYLIFPFSIMGPQGSKGVMDSAGILALKRAAMSPVPVPISKIFVG
jgi:hypothetical protein